MKVIVTGGAGYIGAHVTHALAEAGHTPIVVDDLRCAAKERVGAHAHEPVACEDTATFSNAPGAERYERLRPCAPPCSSAEAYSLTSPRRSSRVLLSKVSSTW